MEWNTDFDNKVKVIDIELVLIQMQKHISFNILLRNLFEKFIQHFWKYI